MHSILLGMGKEFSTHALAEDGDERRRTSSYPISIDGTDLLRFSYPIQLSVLKPNCCKDSDKFLFETFDLGIISLIFLSIFFISKKLEFYDKPNKRKIHSSKILNTGGVIIYIFYLILVNFFEFNHNIELIISIGFFVCIIGFIDDRINLNPSIKIIFILIPSVYLIYNGISLNDLGSYEHIGILNLGKFQIPFLILASGLLINATNYIDGIDGLLLSFFLCCLGYYIFL